MDRRSSAGDSRTSLWRGLWWLLSKMGQWLWDPDCGLWWHRWVHEELWPIGMKSFFHSCPYLCCMDGPERPKRQHWVYKCEKHVTVVVSLQ